MAFNTAITGLKASTIELDVTGNNIANASTVGFKSGRTEFADIFTTVVVGAGSTNNPGAGVIVSDIAQDFTAGTIEFTNNNLDLAVDGSGFFQLADSQGGVSYTRAGGFELDKDGNVVSKNGKFLQGFGLDESGNRLPITNMAVSQKESDPKRTENVDISFNIDSRSNADDLLVPYDQDDATTFTYSTTTSVFDSLGNQHTLKLDMVELPAKFQETTLTFGTAPAAGQTLTVSGVSIDLSSAVTTDDIAAAVAAEETAILAADDKILSVTSNANAVIVRYKAESGQVDGPIVATGPSSGPLAPPSVANDYPDTNETQVFAVSDPVALGLSGTQTISIGGVAIDLDFDALNSDTAVASFIASRESQILGQNPELESIQVDDDNPNQVVVKYKPELGDVATLFVVDDGGTTLFGASPQVTTSQEGDNSYLGKYQLYAYLNNETLLDLGGANPAGTTDTLELERGSSPGPITVEFDTSTGALARVNGRSVAEGGQAPSLSILGADPTIAEQNWQRDDGATATRPRTDLVLDLSGTTQFASESIVKSSTQDGYTKGDLIGVTFADDGTMVASFSNGQNQNLGIVALATFENQGGLQPTGNTEWSATLRSGQAILNPPGSGLNGSLRSAALEQSNVDLSEELVALIEAQRNFQANSRTLQTENQITQAILQIQ